MTVDGGNFDADIVCVQEVKTKKKSSTQFAQPIFISNFKILRKVLRCSNCSRACSLLYFPSRKDEKKTHSSVMRVEFTLPFHIFSWGKRGIKGRRVEDAHIS